MFQPLAGQVVAQMDPDGHRQPGEKEPVRMAFAAEESADETRRLAATTDLQRGQVSREVGVQGAIGVDDPGGMAVRDHVRIAMGNDQHVTGRNGHFMSIAEAHGGRALGHQVIAEHPLRTWCQQMGVVTERGDREAPGAGAFGTVEDGARHPHRLERLG